LVGDEHPWPIRQPLEQLAEELLRGSLIPPSWHEHIQDMAVLIDCPPAIVTFAVDGEEDLIQMPLSARPGPSAPQLIGIDLPKLPAPIAHRFVRQQNATFGHELFDIAVAQAEAKVQPDTVADNFGRESVTLIRVGCGGFMRGVWNERQKLCKWGG